MKKKNIVLVAVLALIVLVIVLIVSSYNGLVDTQQTVEEKESTIDVMLTRRADLIPNLVNTVKGYAAHEEQIYTDLANARAKMAGNASVDEKLEANAQLDSALSRLLVVVENYPELKASQQFIALQDQLEGAENRISTARTDYNKAVKEYNVKIRRFPSNIMAGILGFEVKEMYEAPESSQQTPIVDFD